MLSMTAGSCADPLSAEVGGVGVCGICACAPRKAANTTPLRTPDEQRIIIACVFALVCPKAETQTKSIAHHAPLRGSRQEKKGRRSETMCARLNKRSAGLNDSSARLNNSFSGWRRRDILADLPPDECHASAASHHAPVYYHV